jgi:hypothetical protein
VTDAVRVGLDRFVLDALGSEVSASRSETGTPANRSVIALICGRY